MNIRSVSKNQTLFGALVVSCLTLSACGKKGGDSQQAAQASCQGSWSQWQANYTASSPIVASNKTSPWKIGQSEVSSVLSGNTSITPSSPLQMDGQTVSTLDVANMSMGSSLDARSQAFITRIDELVKTTPKNTLLVVWAGTAHVLDYFLSTMNDNVHYAAYSITADTQYESDEMYKFFDLFNGSPQPKKFAGRDSGVVYFSTLAKIRYFYRTYGKINSDLIFSNKSVDSNVVMLADIHSVKETGVSDNLPSAQCLSELGYNSVTAVFEGQSSTYPVDDKSIQSKVDFRLALGDSREASIKARSKEAHDVLLSGNVTSYPNLKGLWEKLKSYKSQGVKVEYKGLE